MTGTLWPRTFDGTHVLPCLQLLTKPRAPPAHPEDSGRPGPAAPGVTYAQTAPASPHPSSLLLFYRPSCVTREGAPGSQLTGNHTVKA